MIGRQQQLDEILGTVRSAAAGHATANVVFLTGEAGIGKSTLLRAVKEHCEAQPDGPRVVVVECSTPLAGRDIGEVEALQPWIAVMNQLAVDERKRPAGTKKLITELAMAWVKHIPIVGQALEFSVDTVKIIKEHRENNAEASPVFAANQQQLFQQCINVLSKVTERVPIVIALDDAHWADASSLNLLFTAARQLQGRPIVFCVAYRAADAETSRGSDGHPVVRIRNELARYGLCVELGVPQLTSSDLDSLLRSRYPGYVPNAPFESWLATCSGGNALFVTQFLSTLEHDAQIDPQNGAVRDGFKQLAIPATAFAVVQERLRRLSDEDREVLRYASVEGETFTADVLVTLTNLPRLQLLQRLRGIAERNAVILSMGKQRVYAGETTAYRFVHSLMQRALYDSLESEERELLHRAVLDALMKEWEIAVRENTGRAGLAARLAAHAEVLGDNRLAAQALYDGACASWDEFAESETLAQLTRAEETLVRDTNGSPTEWNDELRGKILLKRADVDELHARYDLALQSLRSARPLFERHGLTAFIANTWSKEADTLRMMTLYDESERAAQQGLNVVGDGPPTRERFLLRLDLGNVNVYRGAFDVAEQWYMDAMENARSRNHPSDMMKVLCNLGYLKLRQGNYDESFRLLKDCLTMPEIENNGQVAATILLNFGLVELQRNENDNALDTFIRSRTLYERVGDLPGASKALNNIANVWMNRGDAVQAEEMLMRGLALAKESGDQLSLSYVYANLADVAFLRGDNHMILEWVSLAIPLLDEWHYLGRKAEVLITAGKAYRNLGDLPQARDSFSRAVECAQQAGEKEVENIATEELRNLNSKD